MRILPSEEPITRSELRQRLRLLNSFARKEAARIARLTGIPVVVDLSNDEGARFSQTFYGEESVQ